MMRATSVLRAAAAGESVQGKPIGMAILAHDERHLRRKLIELGGQGGRVMVDLPEPVALGAGDRLVLDDGRHVGIVAADEELYDVRAHDARHLAELAWHIGNRHLAAAVEGGRILIQRDHVIRAMLEGLGATVTDVVEPFEPVRGAYSGGHGHHHDHGHHDADDHPDHHGSHNRGHDHARGHDHGSDDHHHGDGHRHRHD
jgi:urease accessory protein